MISGSVLCTGVWSAPFQIASDSAQSSGSRIVRSCLTCSTARDRSVARGSTRPQNESMTEVAAIGVAAELVHGPYAMPAGCNEPEHARRCHGLIAETTREYQAVDIEVAKNLRELGDMPECVRQPSSSATPAELRPVHLARVRGCESKPRRTPGIHPVGRTRDRSEGVRRPRNVEYRPAFRANPQIVLQQHRLSIEEKRDKLRAHGQ